MTPATIVIGTFLLCCCYLQTANALCEKGSFKGNVGTHDYNHFGKNETEECNWTFEVPFPNEESMLILNVLKYTAFRKGTKNNAYLTLPDGRKIHFHNKQEFLGKCMLFSRKNLKPSQCLQTLAQRYCSADTIESTEWPPKLTSVSMTSQPTNTGRFSYDIDFQFLYMIVSCADLETSQSTYFMSTIGVGSALMIIILLATLVILILIKKSRKTKGNSQHTVNNLPPAYAAPLPPRHTTLSTIVPPNYSSVQESYEAPHYLRIDPPEARRNAHDYCQVEEGAEGSSRSFTIASNNDVVNNALYRM